MTTIKEIIKTQKSKRINMGEYKIQITQTKYGKGNSYEAKIVYKNISHGLIYKNSSIFMADTDIEIIKKQAEKSYKFLVKYHQNSLY